MICGMEHKTTHEEKQRQSEEAPLKVGWDVIHLSDLGISLRHRDGFPNTFLVLMEHGLFRD